MPRRARLFRPRPLRDGRVPVPRRWHAGRGPRAGGSGLGPV